jgi:hypothetical protein
MIYFDAADWAVATNGPGWSGMTTAFGDAPVADRQLDGIFLPHFFDVAYIDPAFGEIQALADAGITSGCATAPAQFCPTDMLTRDQAMAMLSRAFPQAAAPSLPATDPVIETDLAAAITALGGTPPAATDTATTRARAAVLIAHGARLVPHIL